MNISMKEWKYAFISMLLTFALIAFYQTIQSF